MDIWPALCTKILKSNGQRMHRSSYHHLTDDEIDSPEEKEKHQLFDKVVEQKLGKAAQSSDFGGGYETPTYEQYTDDDGDGIGHATDADAEPTPLTFDNYLGAEVVLPKGDDMVAGKVVRRKRDSGSKPIGQENKNPILDTCVYEVEFVDGGRAEFGANAITEHVCTVRCGWEPVPIDGLHCGPQEGWYSNNGGDQYFMMHGRKQQKCTTRGWQLCIKWKDKCTSWEQLSDLKESYPVEVSEYVVACNLQDEPAFSWWVPHVLRK